MPKRSDRRHIRPSAEPVRFHEDRHPPPVPTTPVGNPAEVHDPVHRAVGDLCGPLIVEQIERREGKSGELRSRRRGAQISWQAVPERRHSRSKTVIRVVPPRSSPTFQRIDHSARAGQEDPRDGSPAANPSTSRGKSAGPPGVGSSQTSSSRKSVVSSWIRQGLDVCALLGSVIRGCSIHTLPYRYGSV